jgi:Uma2 family endonuclease
LASTNPSDPLVWAAIRLAESLETYAQEEGLGWFVGGMLPILYREPGTGRRKQVAPDVLVAFVERRDRQSYDLEEEGVFPAFVVEVASPDSVAHDDAAKRTLYDLLGAEEYALFAPGVAGVQETRLWGYRRGAAGTLEDWAPDTAGRLWSTVLGLYLVVQEPAPAHPAREPAGPSPGRGGAGQRGGCPSPGRGGGGPPARRTGPPAGCRWAGAASGTQRSLRSCGRAPKTRA